MAMNLTTIKNTGAETIIHFEGSDVAFATITLANLTAASQARNASTPRVNIVRFVCTGEDTASVIVSRNGKTIIACAPENAPFLDLTSMGITESIQNDQDIKIENKVAKAVSGYITLRKVAGWSGKIETAEFGQYDNETVVGS
jgi:hypothetical protein